MQVYIMKTEFTDGFQHPSHDAIKANNLDDAIDHAMHTAHGYDRGDGWGVAESSDIVVTMVCILSADPATVAEDMLA